MKITVINGTEKHGVTYRLKEEFLGALREQAEITEYYLPKDGPGFCVGCVGCFMRERIPARTRRKCATLKNLFWRRMFLL